MELEGFSTEAGTGEIMKYLADNSFNNVIQLLFTREQTLKYKTLLEAKRTHGLQPLTGVACICFCDPMIGPNVHMGPINTQNMEKYKFQAG